MSYNNSVLTVTNTSTPDPFVIFAHGRFYLVMDLVVRSSVPPTDTVSDIHGRRQSRYMVLNVPPELQGQRIETHCMASTAKHRLLSRSLGSRAACALWPMVHLRRCSASCARQSVASDVGIRRCSRQRRPDFWTLGDARVNPWHAIPAVGD